MKPLVLFVDDQPNILDGLRRSLRHMRKEWELAFASSGTDALEYLDASPIDAIVSDMRMPVIDGAELLTEVAKRQPRAVRFILSGETDEEDALRLVGISHQFLSKPCDTKILVDKLRRTIALRDMLTDEELQSQVAGLNELPCPTEIYDELTELLLSPELSLSKLARIISRDIALTARLLQIAGSGYLGPTRDVSNLDQAIGQLGAERVRALVLKHGVVTKCDDNRLGGFQFNELWNHSMACATLAQAIARAEGLDEISVERAFVAGLLHDVGALVLAVNQPEKYAAVVAAFGCENAARLEAEREAMGASHAAIGAYLAGLWGLNEIIVEAVAHHHTPRDSSRGTFDVVTAVHVAEGLVQALHGAGDGETYLSVLDFDYLEAVGVRGRLEEWGGPPHPVDNRKGLRVTDKVLFVDDEANVLAAISRQLRRKFDASTAVGGEKGLEVLKSEGPFAVVVSDMRMPGMDGLQFLREVKGRSPETVRMTLTGNADQKTAVDAVNEGSVFRFYTKPCESETLASGVKAAIKHYDLITAERVLLERTLAGSIKVLVDLISLFDPKAFEKTTTLRAWAGKLAKQLDMPNVWELDMAAMLSPIGQVTLPAETLAKIRADKPLTDAEKAMTSRTPEISRNLLANISRLECVSELVYFQDKGFDGSSFPNDVTAGRAIPLGARILKVLIDLAKAEDRVGEGLPAVDELENQSQRYDPEILSAVRSCLFGAQAEPTEAAAEEILELRIGNLLSGDKLISNIETDDQQLLLAAGQVISDSLLERLRNLQKIHTLKEPVHVVRPQE